MGVFASHHVNIRRNSNSRNGDIGLLSDDADAILIKRNSVAGNPELGMLPEGDDNVIAANRLVRNGEGIGLTGNDNAIRRNHVFKVRFFAGINVDGGDRNLIAHNRIRGSRRDGIVVGFPFARHGEDNKLIGNRVRDVGRTGSA